MRSRALPVADEASVTKRRGRQVSRGSGESSGTTSGVAKQLRALSSLVKKRAESTIDKHSQTEYNQKKKNNLNSIANSLAPVANGAATITDSDSEKMVNFLYSEESLGKNMDFLKRNDYPSPVDRKLNQQYYGKANEFKNLANRLKTQTENIINPKLPDATDRAFLSGLMGDEREDQEYQKQLANAKDTKADFAKAFNGSPFEGLFNTNVNAHNTVPIKNQGLFDVTSTVNRNPNRKLTPDHAINRNPNTSPTVTQLPYDIKHSSTTNNNRENSIEISQLKNTNRLGGGIWSLKNDSPGVSILSHWLFGGGKDYIHEDGYWGQYMKSNEVLKSKVKNIVLPLADGLKNNESKDVDITTSMVIENGEDIIGYQYLHGTDENAGGFKIKGKIYKDSYGNVTYDLKYTWNDIINPNLEYSSDYVKSEFAKSIPFADPKDYAIRISWNDKTVIKANPGWFNWNSGWLK